MIALLIRAAALTVIYLLVLTSLAPGDVATGAALGLAVAFLLRPRGPIDVPLTIHAVPGRLVAASVVAALTALEMALGSWRVMVACVRGPVAAGPVEIPRAGRTDADSAIWGVLTGEAPDEIVLDVDAERDVLVVHLIDASDPDSVRERHRRMYSRWLRRLTH